MLFRSTGNGAASLSLPGLVIGNSKVANETSIGHSQSSDFAVNHSSYVVAHGDGTAMQIATNHRVDTVIYNSPGNFIWAGFDRMIWAGTQTPNAARPAEHVGRYIQTVRQEVGTSSSGGPLPQPSLWAACLEYHDFTNKPSSWTGASLVVEMDFMANGPDDGNSRAIQALVIGQGNPAGEPCEVGTVIGVSIMRSEEHTSELQSH